MDIMNDLALSFLGGVGATAFIWLGTLLYGRAMKILVNRGVPVLGKHAIIVIGSYRGFKQDWPDDVWVHEEGVHAARALSGLFTKWHVDHEYVSDKSYAGEEAAGIELCVGGPVVNTRTAYYIKTYGGIFDDLSSNVRHDEAWIVKLTVPSSPRGTRCVLLLYGCGSFDTVAAVTYFTHYFSELSRQELRQQNRALRLRTRPSLGVGYSEIIAILDAGRSTQSLGTPTNT